MVAEPLTRDMVRRDTTMIRYTPRTRIRRQTVVPPIACFAGLFTGDLVAFLLSAVGALLLINAAGLVGLEPAGLAMPGLAQLYAAMPKLGLVFSWVLIYLVIKGHYSKRLAFWCETRQIVEAGFFALLGTSFVEFAMKANNSRQLMVATWILFAIMSVVTRRMAKFVLARIGVWKVNVLLIDDARTSADAAGVLGSDSALGYNIVGRVSPKDVPTSKGCDSLQELLTAYGADRLVLTIDTGSAEGRRFVKEAVRQGVPFSLLTHSEGVPVFGIEQVAFLGHDTVLLSFRNGGDRHASRLAKTLFDFVLASLLLFLLAVPMAFIALLVRLDGGPALFGHARIGAGGRTFRCLKFRTMVMDADKVLAELLANDKDARDEWNETQKLRYDPRITRIGKVLRATSLDELPQLLNVLFMDMSLVGPRPIVKQEVHRYADDISYYYGTKPGLTGLWQVSGRSETTYSKRVHLDSWYVRNWSIWHDVAILLKTIPAVLYRQGAR